MTRWNKLIVSLAAAVAVAGAYASGWSVTVLTSDGVLNPGSVVSVVPATVIANPLPQVTFNTTAAVPAPILVGDGTSFTNGTFTGVYAINDLSNSKGLLTGFNFVVSGFVQGTGRIVWFKKVVDRNTSEILYDGTGVFLGDAYPGGINGAFSLNIFIPLSRPSSNFTVFEAFFLDIAGANAPGVDTAGLLLVEQDWVPEPASLIALATGLGALALRRRKK
ncbi:PEP-CTERM sorting domain-containing protein [Synechococcus sp. RC10B2]|uniref:PEP-CTERM sorting domain-containing protein n=1 Tax=Synechococcus sp. RC10B2 TaxID=2964530 RepID=UPI0039C6C47A